MVQKNSVVALIPATILADEIVTLDGVPDISDVASLIDIMTSWGQRWSEMGRLLLSIHVVYKICQCHLERSIVFALLTISTEVFWDVMARQLSVYQVDVT